MKMTEEMFLEIKEKIKNQDLKQSEFEDILAEYHITNEQFSKFISKAMEHNLSIQEEDQENEAVEDHVDQYYYSDNILEQYFHEITIYKLLSKEEEIECIKKAKSGDEDAREKLITSNLRLVAKIALKYSKSGIHYMDLIQDGTIGLINSIEKFDETKGYRFSTYATWWIKKEIIDSLKKRINTIKIPNYIYLLNKKIEIFERDYYDKHGKKPSEEKIAQELDLNVEEVVRVKKALQMNIINLKERDKSGLKDYSTVDEIDKDLEEISQKLKVSKLLKKLNYKERKIIEMYYGLGKDGKYNFREIASELELTPERVKLLKDRAIGKLKYAGERMWSL